MGLKQLDAPSNLPYVQEGKGDLSREHWKMGRDECLALNTLLREVLNEPEASERDSWWDDLNGDVCRGNCISPSKTEEHDFEGRLKPGNDNLDDEERRQVAALRKGLIEDMEINRRNRKEQNQVAKTRAQPLQETSSNKRAAEEELQQGASDKRTRLETTFL